MKIIRVVPRTDTTSILILADDSRIIDVQGKYSEWDDYPKEDKSLRYNQWKPDWTYVHFWSLVGMVRVLEFWAKKYSRDNWKKPTDLNTILASAQRHLADMIDGNPIDADSWLPNHDHLLCNLLFYAYHYNKNRDTISQREVTPPGVSGMEGEVTLSRGL